MKMKKIKRMISLSLCFASLLCTASCIGEAPSTDTSAVTDAETQPGTDFATEEETTSVTDAETIPPKDEKSGVISVIAAGDNLAHEAVYTYAKALAQSKDGYGKEYYFDSMYDDVRDVVRSADLAIINQESQVRTSGTPSGYPRFASPAELGEAVMNAGFNVIVSANNHMLDKGDEGLIDTADYWYGKPVMHVGVDKSEDDGMDISVFEKDGFKTAILAYTTVINHASTAVKESKYAKYTYYSDEIAEKQIKEAERIADFVIVSMHWGDEDEFDPDSSQKKIAKKLAGWGADAIIGHHPHVVQTIEWIETENGKTLCVYSLGNFLSTMLYARNMVGMMVSFDIVTDDGEPYITNVKAIPTVTHYSPAPSGKGLEYRADVAVYLMENYTDDMASAHGCNENESKAVTLDKLKSYITDNVPQEFLPDYLK